MASIPSRNLIKSLQKASKKAEDKKRKDQNKQSKDFENTGAGVIPEGIWQELKK